MGSGRTELALSLFGNVPEYKIISGEISIDGELKKFKHPKDAIKAGLAYATEDRKRDGLVLIQDIKYNTTIANLERVTNGIIINENEEIRIAKEFQESINIKAPSIKGVISKMAFCRT